MNTYLYNIYIFAAAAAAAAAAPSTAAATVAAAAAAAAEALNFVKGNCVVIFSLHLALIYL